MTGLVEGRRYHIGFGMGAKKVKSIFQDSLIDLAFKRGIDLVPIDLGKPLVDQGPFDAIVHKLYGQDGRKQLAEFSAKHPNVVIVDQLDNIEKLHNRVIMLQVVNDVSVPPQSSGNIKFDIPRQVLVESSSADDRVAAEELNFPVIAKPILANGTESSHKMFLVFNTDGLVNLQPPFVLQEFVNHGGVVFKVYVAGDHVRCVKRRSLPDISKEKLKATPENLLPFPRISNLTDQDLSDDSIARVIEAAEMPPTSFFTELAHALRRGLSLNLFNFDMIRDSNDPNRYLVIDINYFPGYSKLPSYETMLTDFFLDIVRGKNIADSSVGDSASDDHEPA